MNARWYRRRGAVLIVTSLMFLLLSASTVRTDEAAPASTVLAGEQHESGSEVSLLELKRTSGAVGAGAGGVAFEGSIQSAGILSA